MLQTKLNISDNEMESKGVDRNFLSSLGLVASWGFITAMILGTFFAGLWTMIPTEFLSWGASKTNFLGYVSHCPFTPISTFTLITVSFIGVLIAKRMDRKNPLGYTTFIFGLMGIFLGIITDGFDTSMLMYGGYGIVLSLVVLVCIESFEKVNSNGVRA